MGKSTPLLTRDQLERLKRGLYNVVLIILIGSILVLITTNNVAIEVPIAPLGITGLTNYSYADNYILWTWSDPTNIDPNFLEISVYIDGRYITDVPGGIQYYNATNLDPNTQHTIDTQTYDRRGFIYDDEVITDTERTASTPINTPTWFGDFETGDTSQWTLECSAGRNDNINIVTSPVRQGIYSGRFRVYNGDYACGGERAEVSQITNEKEGDNLYYAWSTMFPVDWVNDTDWGSIFNQWHDFDDKNPPLSFALDNIDNNIYVNECAGNVTGNAECGGFELPETFIANMNKGAWHDFILHVKWTTTNSGQVEIWHKLENQSNFTKVLNSTGHPTLQYKSGNLAGNATITTHQMGLYRGANGIQPTQTLYEDGYRVGKTFDSVLYK